MSSYCKIKCLNCGKIFKAQNSHFRYCSDECRREVESSRELKKKLKKMNDSQNESKSKVEKNAELAKLSAEAKRLGMSYGKYIALLESRAKY